MLKLSKIDRATCKACEKCVQICREDVFEMVEDQGQIISSVKYAEKCSNCGLCFVHCEKNGEPILVKKNPKKNGERVVSVDEKKCDACERCVKVCPEHNFEMVEKDGKVVAKVKDADKCRGDDHCVFVCEECDAIICK